MHQRIVIAVSAVLFALLAVVAGIATDLHDRFVPLGLGARSAITLDFGDTDISDEEAFRNLGTLSDRLGLGLVKVVPDLRGDQSGQVVVPVGADGNLPDEFPRFGYQPAAEVRGSDALAHSYASGRYLVTGDTASLADFEAWLATNRIDYQRSEGTLSATLQLLVRQSDFGTSLHGIVALMVSLVLYWLAIKARGRALRVLAGVSTWRIQYEDLTGFLAAMMAAAIICNAVAVVYVGLVHHWVFVPWYVTVLLTFDAVVILTTMTGAVVLSVVSRPGARMLAAREPAVKSLRTSSVAVKIVTFVLVLAAVAPAFSAYTRARDVAAEQAQWKSLADQVVLSYSFGSVGNDGGESEFRELMPDVGNLVRDAERRDSVALSYTWTGDGPNQFDLGAYDAFSLINQRWLDLMLPVDQDGDARGSEPNPALTPIALDQVPTDAREFLGPHMELWTRDELSADEALSKVSFYRYSGSGTIPLSSSGGWDLLFSDDAIVVLVPHLYEMFTDSFLVSASTSNNLVFTGLGPTQELIARNGLRDSLGVKYVAEEGILFAQFTAYFALLRAGSVVALLVALGMSAAIVAFITALLRAKRDFPLRLAGKPWLEILRARVAREWAIGIALAALVILLRGQENSALVAAVAVLALLISPLTHLVAARWAFANVSLRRM